MLGGARGCYKAKCEHSHGHGTLFSCQGAEVYNKSPNSSDCFQSWTIEYCIDAAECQTLGCLQSVIELTFDNVLGQCICNLPS